ncbi:MAG: PTS glucose transporter subunit IIA [Coriobacteriaceae bacterium]
MGIDTVKIEGKGSTHSVKAGERVKAGQPLGVFDDDKILDAN